MAGKILIIALAFIAGAGAVYGYQYASENLTAPSQKEEDPRIVELDGRLTSLAKRVEELSNSQQAAGSETEVVVARLNTLDGRFAELQKKQGELAMRTPSAPGQNPAQAGEDGPGRRLSGEELARALRELPEEGRKLIRSAIYEEVKRAKEENGPKLPTKEELEKKATAGIQKLAGVLSLTPVQVAQIKEIAARQIDRILEVARVAKERDDPAYAEDAKKEMQADIEREVVEILTPEQLDRLREMDPEGFGKRHPRGF